MEQRIQKSNLHIIFINLLLLLNGCGQAQLEMQLSGKDFSAIRSVLDTYANGWNAKNPQKTIMSLFVEDAVLLPHHGVPPVEGKENIQKHFWPTGLTGFKVNSYDFEIMEITGRDDMAYSRGRYSISFSFESNGEKKTINNSGNYVMIFRLIETNWKISRYIWNDPIPQEE